MSVPSDETTPSNTPNEPPFSEKQLDDFLEIVKSRRAIRNFQTTPIAETLLNQLLDAARWAPSGYNLQPTHLVVVTDQPLKDELCQACFGQRQIREAGATVVFTGDRRVYPNNLDRVLASEREIGAVNEKYEAFMRKYIKDGFSTGPMGMGWLWKSMEEPFFGGRRPVASAPAVHRRFWLSKQVCLAAMNFMLAATAAGLGTCPMEGFGESQVRQVLKIPSHQTVVLVIPVGYPVEEDLTKSRLPLQEIVHHNGW
ncbi:Nitroreductase domain-containing protein [Planctomycetales bacterium 10988]|nr:Nitroreductase domain-containing protein [Planctomycetales bacterium 10988]